ncbi:AraC family transcriptional regulator [Streptomyces sp. NPDC096324]|uniref:AraC family transcriptional regulator n=1 Tax=Streptomyces sp. NPDC096324 TaxID=3366085 RepID=UPI00382747BE
MQPQMRTTGLANYVDLVRSLGGDPLALMRTAGLDPAALAAADHWLPVAAVAQLLEDTATATGCPDFGLRLAELTRFSNLGPIGLVAREEPSVRSALELLIQHLHLYNEALRAEIAIGNGLAGVWMDLELGAAPNRRSQGTDMLVGVCHRLIGRLLGPDWTPVGVTFNHAAPDDPRPYHRVLGPAITFDQPRSGIVLYPSDLEAPNTLADPRLRPYTRQFLQNIAPSPGSAFTDRVRQVTEALLPTGRCSLEQLARTFDLDARTLQRRLVESGEGYSSILDSVRTDLARRYVGDSKRPLTEIAGLLGFSSLAAFSRWFRGRFETSPSTWRTHHEQP